MSYLLTRLERACVCGHFVWRKSDTDQGGDRRPGILVLINDTDWELEGEGDYILQPGDEVVFISTLHGG